MDSNEFLTIAMKHAGKIAPTYGVDAGTIAQHLLAIAKVESNMRPTARNKNSTARGILQMLICTQREVEKKRAKVEFAPAMFSCKSYKTSTVDESKDRILIDVDYAIMLSTYELCYQFKRYKNIEKAVHAYNQGSYPGGRMKDGASYVKKVFAKLGTVPNSDYATVTSQQTESVKNVNGGTVSYPYFY